MDVSHEANALLCLKESLTLKRKRKESRFIIITYEGGKEYPGTSIFVENIEGSQDFEASRRHCILVPNV